jgi:hypothetical protein
MRAIRPVLDKRVFVAAVSVDFFFFLIFSTFEILLKIIVIFFLFIVLVEVDTSGTLRLSAILLHKRIVDILDLQRFCRFSSLFGGSHRGLLQSFSLKLLFFFDHHI